MAETESVCTSCKSLRKHSLLLDIALCLVLLTFYSELTSAKTVSDSPTLDSYTTASETLARSSDKRHHSKRGHDLKASFELGEFGSRKITRVSEIQSNVSSTHNTNHLEPKNSRNRNARGPGMVATRLSPSSRMRHRHGHMLPRSRSKRQRSRSKQDNTGDYGKAADNVQKSKPILASGGDKRNTPQQDGGTGLSSSASKRIPINVVVLLPEEETRLFSIKRVRPAIKLATENVTSSRILTRHELVTSYADSKCHIAEAMNEAIKSTTKGWL
ncbi:atrial natriuretic peptide clearance receptor [Elysia marginata]|uniref:Atrial natriuretic peptide clearance receptor n=1 Tax=Elysia marginata TaxID=1093978 RepID=A0AAV4G4R0_9GAST|nr:atrial natriuretic peptide clearance receptor [Elysia marginata]